MVVLDITIVNVALPSAQAALDFSDASRQWIVTAYALAFGSLLLLGGRLGDLFGRKQVFITGLLGFATASAVGGAATSVEMLIGARAAQGLFGALLAPAALSILTTTFTEPGERAHAFGIFSAIAGGGAAIGLLLGGMLTEWASWRWCLYVNIAFAVPTAIAATRLLASGRPAQRPGIDVPGTVLASSGLFFVVFGFSRAEVDGWGSTAAVGSFVAAIVLLGGFLARQRVAAHPLLPLSVLLNRARGGAYLAMLVAGSGMFAGFLFLTYFMQQNLGFSPLETGAGFLPMTAAIIATAQIVTRRLLPNFGPRVIVRTGMLFAAAAMLGFTTLSVDSSYVGGVLPFLILQGIGMGCVFVPAFQTGTHGIAPMHAGVASAMVNTSQQVGGSIGTAALSTIAASAMTDSLAAATARSPEVLATAAIHGYTSAFTWAAGIFLFGAVATSLLLPGGRLTHGAAPNAEPAVAH
ncbi:MAG: MFS transporter [Solirubrobacteraceae bacterium]|nr:MFS transporter [Solirubrobacteraceae bacterium]